MKVLTQDEAVRLAHRIVEQMAEQMDAQDSHPGDMARVFIFAAALAEGCVVAAATARGDGCHVSDGARVETLEMVEAAKVYAPTLTQQMIGLLRRPG